VTKSKQTKRNNRAKRAAPSSTAALTAWCAARARWVAPAVVGLAAVAMMCWTWGTWADVVIDFGRELYIPWRLTEGEVLYRDLAHFNGPLSPYVNSLWFRLFGTSLRVLALVNFALLGVLLALLYSLLSQIGSRTSALLGCLLFVAVFAFSALGYNFNYICPYAHEMTHGLLLSLAAIFFVARYVRTGRLMDIALCGLCAGFVFLTKPEIFVAVLPATTVGIALAFWSHGQAATRIVPIAAAFLGPMLAPAIVAVALLSLAMPTADAVAGTLGGFRWILAPEVTMMPFYRRMRGTDDLGQGIVRILSVSAAYGLLLGLPAIVGILWRRQRQWQMLGAAVVFVAATAVLWRYADNINWGFVLVPVPLIILCALVAFAVQLLGSATPANRSQLILPVTFALFSLLLMAKVILKVRVDNYGFVLAVPAVLIAVVAMWDWLPRAIERLGGAGTLLRAGLLAMLTIDTYVYLNVQKVALDERTVRVGTGGDAIWWNPRGHEVNRILAQIEASLPRDATLVAIPEGVMLNYLSRRRNPTGYISYMPLETLLFGEDQILDGFEQHPPDALLVLTRDLQIYDVKPFGEGYAQRLRAWLVDHYRPVEPAPARPGQFQIVLMKPRDSEDAQNHRHEPADQNVTSP